MAVFKILFIAMFLCSHSFIISERDITLLSIEKKPSSKLLDFRKKVAPTPEDMKEILEFEFKKNTLH